MNSKRREGHLKNINLVKALKVYKISQKDFQAYNLINNIEEQLHLICISSGNMKRLDRSMTFVPKPQFMVITIGKISQWKTWGIHLIATWYICRNSRWKLENLHFWELILWGGQIQKMTINYHKPIFLESIKKWMKNTVIIIKTTHK